MEDDWHKTASVGDKLTLLGEIEHLRRHLLRSYVSSSYEEEDCPPYLIYANQAKRLRRTLQKRWFPELDEKDWCAVKAAASLRQLSYEVFEDDKDSLIEVDELVDSVLSLATGEDFSGCAACREDKENPSAE